MAREGLFSSIADLVPGVHVLDLYAGTGALGIEALSRGAERAVFVEQNRAALRTIAENLARTRMTERAEVVAADAGAFVTRDDNRGRAFDLALVDPPYDAGLEGVQRVLAGLGSGRLAAPGCTVILTRRTGSSMPVIPVHWLLTRRLEYGDTLVLIFQEA